MATYSKLIVDGKCVKVWKGAPAKDVVKKLGLSGIHIELSSKEEYGKFCKPKTKPKAKEQLMLF